MPLSCIVRVGHTCHLVAILLAYTSHYKCLISVGDIDTKKKHVLKDFIFILFVCLFATIVVEIETKCKFPVASKNFQFEQQILREVE